MILSAVVQSMLQPNQVLDDKKSRQVLKLFVEFFNVSIGTFTFFEVPTDDVVLERTKHAKLAKLIWRMYQQFLGCRRSHCLASQVFSHILCVRV